MSSPNKSQPLKPFAKGDKEGFARLVSIIIDAETPTPTKSEFDFNFTVEAAQHNSRILEKYNFDLETAIEAQESTEQSMGSELRPVDQLSALFHHHPKVDPISEAATVGVDYPVDDLPEETRKELVANRLKKGNQKSALNKEAIPIVTNLLRDDVEHGYSIIVTPECLEKLKGCELYSMGLQHQFTVDENGDIAPKKRLTHNLSDDKKSGNSVNQRTREEDLPETMYGFALSRSLHLIHHLRYHNPNVIIYLAKVDIKSAYRRIHTKPRISVKCCAQYHTPSFDDEGEPVLREENRVGTVTTRLPFGSSTAPGAFSNISEATFDLATDLIDNPHWNPNVTRPYLHHLISDPEPLEEDIPFAPALKADVVFPERRTGGCDGYLDDAISITLGNEENADQIERTKFASIMALDLTFRPNKGDKEPVPRPEVASVKKLLAEGTLKEVIVFLGWLINTRLFQISLPKDKAAAWIKSIVEILNKKSAGYKELATLVGRLNHVCYIIPAARHFINRIRRVQDHADKYSSAKLNQEVKKDLKLWIRFITYARDGISINNVVFRTPTTIVLTDASETGIGGFCSTSNILWRYRLTTEEQKAFSLNTKEYLAAILGALIALKSISSSFPCVLSVSDSSSVVSWLYKSNHDPNSSPCHNELARWHAQNLLEAEACDYSQHIKGPENVVADSLSRDFHLSDNKILSLLQTTCSHLLPSNPQIMTLEPQSTLISKVASIAQLQPKPRELNWRLTPSTIAAGVTGWHSASEGGLPTPIWRTSPPSTEHVSYPPSWTKFGTESSLDCLPLRETPRDRPQIMWLRPSSQVVGKTHD